MKDHVHIPTGKKLDEQEQEAADLLMLQWLQQRATMKEAQRAMRTVERAMASLAGAHKPGEIVIHDLTGRKYRLIGVQAIILRAYSDKLADATIWLQYSGKRILKDGRLAVHTTTF
jgi:hypothetical protein